MPATCPPFGVLCSGCSYNYYRKLTYIQCSEVVDSYFVRVAMIFNIATSPATDATVILNVENAPKVTTVTMCHKLS